MTNNDLFQKARDLVSESLILNYFDTPKSKKRKRSNGTYELQTLCPFRSDKNIGSFEINLTTGMWQDYSTKDTGDFIKLVELAFNLKPVDAAEKIIKDSGGVMPDKKETKPEPEKPKAIIPIPESARSFLKDHINGKYIIEHFGKPSTGWQYKQPDGSLWMCVVRHIKEDGSKKEDIPYYYTEHNKWRAGCPVNKKRHLYNSDLINGNGKILISEGNKCCDIEVDGWLSVTWWGGGNQIKNYNWKPLKEKEVLIWPDYDKKCFKDEKLKPDIQQPGLLAALDIRELLPNSKILNVYDWCRDNDKKDGWDIADAEEEDIDLNKFIEDRGYYETNNGKTFSSHNEKGKENKKNIKPNSGIVNDGNGGDRNKVEADDNEKTEFTPFKFLGFDEGRHFFLPEGSNIVKKLTMGQITKNKLLELAPLSYWLMEFPMKRGFEIDSAIDWVIRESEKKGFFKPDLIRGAGVWLHEKQIVVNDGTNVVNQQGEKIKLSSKYHYVLSDKDMGKFNGKLSTHEMCNNLIDLFAAQGFETIFEAMCVMGWALIAPFGGILEWRPHIWVTGPCKSGKTWVLENLIHALCGPFAFVGTGKDTEAGLYRSLCQDPCPVIKDEMEPNKSKDAKKKIEDILEVARNASSNFSSSKTIANQSGGVDRFCIRSMFCFSSIIPYLVGEAIESRVLVCRLKNINFVKDKFKMTKQILETGVMADPGMFRRKIFMELKNIIYNIEIVKKIIMSETLDNRKADNLAPIFSAWYAIDKGGKLENENINKMEGLVKSLVAQIDKSDEGSDEEKLLRKIFEYTVRLQTNENITIAELIMECENELTANEDKKNVLSRHGIRVYDYSKVKGLSLAIARDHSAIQKILIDTIYSGRYVEVLKRHEAARNESPSVRYAGGKKNSILLEWDVIKKKYLSDVEVKLDVSTSELLDVF